MPSRKDRNRGPRRARTLAYREVSQAAARSPIVPDHPRPATRGECALFARPCPYFACRYHLALDVTPAGGIKINHPESTLEDLPSSCSLDLADRYQFLTLEEVGDVLNITRERVRQIETRALVKVRAALHDLGHLQGDLL